MTGDDLKQKIDSGKEKVNEFIDDHEVKEKLKTGKEKVQKGVNGLPFRSMAEKIPNETRLKFPFLNKLIPFANLIACGLIALLLVVVIANVGGG